jgi:DNA-binding transcriptional LysR family regulator
MELRHLRYFVAVAEDLHFTRAARRLNIAQPPLSEQIRNLEDEIGVQLLARTKRSVRLTDAGRAFLEEARRTLAHVEQAVRVANRAAAGEVGALAIGFVPTADLSVLPKVIPEFGRRFPDVRLELHSMTGADQVEALLQSRIQLGILLQPVDNDAFIVETILREQFVMVLPEKHRLAARRRVPVASLAFENYIFFPRRIAPRTYDMLVSFCRSVGVSLRVTQEPDHVQTALSLIAAGLGVSLFPASVQQLQRKGITYRRLSPPVPWIDMCVAYRKDTQSQAVRNFVVVVREAMRRSP